MAFVKLRPEGGSLTATRQLSRYAYGRWGVQVLEEALQEPPENLDELPPEIQESFDDRLVNGYVADLERPRQGRFDIGFVRADASMDMNTGTSDTERQIDTASVRSEGRIFFEADITAGGHGRFVPGEHFWVNDVVDARLWGKDIETVVTEVSMLPGGGWRTHVGGQLITDSEALRSHMDDVTAQIESDKREALRGLVETKKAATEAKATAESAERTAGEALTAATDADGTLQGHVDTARRLVGEAEDAARAAGGAQSDAAASLTALRAMSGASTEVLLAQIIAEGGVLGMMQETDRLLGETQKAQSGAIRANTEAVAAASSAASSALQVSNLNGQAIEILRDVQGEQAEAVTLLEAADAAHTAATEDLSLNMALAMTIYQQLLARVEAAESRIMRVWVPGSESSDWSGSGSSVVAKGSWIGRAIAQVSSQRISYDDQDTTYGWVDQEIAVNRSLPGRVELVLYWRDQTRISSSIEGRFTPGAPARSTWHLVLSKSAENDGKLSGSVSVVWSAATHHDTYGVRVVAGGKTVSRQVTKLGPLTSLGNGRRTLSLSVNSVVVEKGRPIRVEVFSSASSSSQRHVESVSVDLLNLGGAVV